MNVARSLPKSKIVKEHRDASPHGDFCEPAQYLRSLGRLKQRTEQKNDLKIELKIHPKTQQAQEHFKQKNIRDETVIPRTNMMPQNARLLTWQKRNTL